MAAGGCRRFLAEWYLQECDQDMVNDFVERMASVGRGKDVRAGVRLVLTLAVPSDEVVFGVFEAPSADAVAWACALAGLAPLRVTAAVHSTLTRGSEPRVVG